MLLHRLCETPNVPIDLIRKVLILNESALTTPNLTNALPIHGACAQPASFAVMELLLQRSEGAAMCAAVDSEKRLALHLFTGYRSLSTLPQADEILALLLEAHFEGIREKDENDQRPFNIGVKSGMQDELLKELVCTEAMEPPPEGYETTLSWACATGKSFELIHKIFEAGREAAKVPDSRNGNMPLHDAVGKGDVSSHELIELLVKMAPEAVTLKNKAGRTVCHIAMEAMDRKLDDTMRILMEHDPHNMAAQEADYEGRLLIHLACASKQPQADGIAMIADVSPDGLQKEDKENNIALHSALLVGDAMPVETIRKLLDMYPGATKIKNKAGELPLHA